MLESEAKYEEKRLFCRMNVTADVTIDVPDTNSELKGQCINLSHSGILFDTEGLMHEGQTLKILIDTRSDKFQPMNATIQIIRVETAGNNQNRIAGKILEFK